MKLSLNETYNILSNQHELDELRNDSALKLFRIATNLEDAFKAEFKAVEKAQKDQDRKELDKLGLIEKEIEGDPFTQEELKEHGLLSAKILRIFKSIIDVKKS